jgi:hypothetical protein
MPWYTDPALPPRGPKGRRSKSIRRTARIWVERLEKRWLFAAAPFLPQRLNPVDGVGGYNLAVALFRPATTDLQPTLGLNTGSISVSGSFVLADAGSYTMALQEVGPYGSGSFAFAEWGTISYTFTEAGTFNAGGFSPAASTFTQTAPLSWSFLQTDAGGNTVSYQTGLSSFTTQDPGSGPFDPLFAFGFNWFVPTRTLSGLNALGVLSLTATGLTVTQNGGDSFTLQESNGSATLAGNGCQALADFSQTGQQTYQSNTTDAFGYTNQGNNTFALSEVGSYANSNYAFTSVAYNETGSNSFALSRTAVQAATTTLAAAGNQCFAGSLHTLGLGSAQTTVRNSLSTSIYAENGTGSYAFYQGGSYGGAGFALGSLAYSNHGTGSFSLTQNAVETQTGTLTSNQAVAGTDRHGVAGTITNADTVANLGNLTQTAASTLTEQGSANYTLNELGGYGGGSWALGCFSLTENAAGNFTSQKSDALTEAGNGTVNRAGSGLDCFALTLAGAHTVTGAGAAAYADNETYHFTENATDSTTEAGQESYQLSELGSAQGGGYALGSYAFRTGRSGTRTAANTVTDGATGYGSGTESGTDQRGVSANFGGSNSNDLGNDTFADSESFQFGSAATYSGTDNATFTDMSYRAGGFGNASYSLNSVTHQHTDNDTWTRSGTDSSTAAGTYAGTDTGTGQDGGGLALGSVIAGGLGNDTTVVANLDTATALHTDTVNESGFDSTTASEQGAYGGGSYAFSNTTYQGTGNAAETLLDSARDTFGAPPAPSTPPCTATTACSASRAATASATPSSPPTTGPSTRPAPGPASAGACRASPTATPSPTASPSPRPTRAPSAAPTPPPPSTPPPATPPPSSAAAPSPAPTRSKAPRAASTASPAPAATPSTRRGSRASASSSRASTAAPPTASASTAWSSRAATTPTGPSPTRPATPSPAAPPTARTTPAWATRGGCSPSAAPAP